MGVLGRTSRWWLDALFRPGRFVASGRSGEPTDRTTRVAYAFRLIRLYTLNLFVYAFPAAVASPRLVSGAPGEFLTEILFVSILLISLTVFTYWLFYAGLRLTGYRVGILETARVIIYGVAIYLASSLTIARVALVFPNVNEYLRLTVARGMQRILEPLLDAVGSGQTAGAFVRTHPAFADVSFAAQLPTLGQLPTLLLAAAIVAALYFLWSVYLTARLEFGVDPVSAAVTTGLVLTAPFLILVLDVISIQATPAQAFQLNAGLLLFLGGLFWYRTLSTPT
jgi:hypothetical protein